MILTYIHFGGSDDTINQPNDKPDIYFLINKLRRSVMKRAARLIFVLLSVFLLSDCLLLNRQLNTQSN
jgi:hypothetical protein